MENKEKKFRAWDKENGKMRYNGFVITSDGRIKFDNNSGSVYSEIMQYTRRKDKNGVEVYEGDILKDDVGDVLEVKFGKLPLDKSGDCVCSYEAFYCKNYGQLGQSAYYECQDIGGWMEVIGNIYQNPELLKK